jgi:hypothetical protein
MDAAEGMRLLDGSSACWLRMTDERSGAILATHAFAEYRWAKVPAQQTQRCLRQTFGLYGCPKAVRVDNGIP